MKIVKISEVKLNPNNPRLIKDCKALPKEYRPTEKAPTCFYEMTHR